jgi:hypothetical protein
LLKDQHSNQQWRSAAAAVFVEARTLEQDICSDLPLQQGLLLACQQLQQQQQQDDTQPSPNSSSSSSSEDTHSLLLLGKALLKHMQLEGLSPLGFAGLKPNQDAEPQVLSAEQQASILSALQAQQRLLVKRLQELLLSPSMAPVVQLDAESREVLLGPLQQLQSAAAAAAEVPGTQRPEQSTAPAAPAAAAAGSAAAEEADVVLSLSLVQQLLMQHPSPEVRVWALRLAHSQPTYVTISCCCWHLLRVTILLHPWRSYLQQAAASCYLTAQHIYHRCCCCCCCLGTC